MTRTHSSSRSIEAPPLVPAEIAQGLRLQIERQRTVRVLLEQLHEAVATGSPTGILAAAGDLTALLSPGAADDPAGGRASAARSASARELGDLPLATLLLIPDPAERSALATLLGELTGEIERALVVRSALGQLLTQLYQVNDEMIAQIQAAVAQAGGYSGATPTRAVPRPSHLVNTTA